MHSYCFHPIPRPRRTQRGSALVIALVLVLVMTMIVAATQLQTTQQLKASKSQRNYEVALQMAEAGANAYLNELSNKFEDSTYAFLPPKNSNPAASGSFNPQPTTITAFRMMNANATSTFKMKYFPVTGQTKQSYYVYDTGIGAGGLVGIYAFGWCDGAVRMIHLNAQSSSIFDWAAIYGLNPNTNGSNFAWKFSGSASVIGATGAEGLFIGNNNATFYDGPVIWANSSYASPYNNPDPTVLTSGSNVPQGHVGSPGLASPLYRHYVRKLNVPTADSDANDWAKQINNATTTLGVEYFRTYNDDNTGLRLLAYNNVTNTFRELPVPYPIPTTGNSAYQLTPPLAADYKKANSNASLGSNESGGGIRVYPGNYFFTQVTMNTSDLIFLRTYADGETLDSSIARPITVSNNQTNPNSAAAASGGTIRFWIGHASSGSDPASTFAGGAGVTSGGTYMEYPKYASRFRIYMASSGGITVKGNNTSPPPPFRVNLLAYNDRDKNGNTVAPYGDVQFQSSVYLYGSLIGWSVTVTGGSTIEKESAEPGAGDRLAFKTFNWSELQ